MQEHGEVSYSASSLSSKSCALYPPLANSPMTCRELPPTYPNGHSNNGPTHTTIPDAPNAVPTNITLFLISQRDWLPHRSRRFDIRVECGLFRDRETAEAGFWIEVRRQRAGSRRNAGAVCVECR